MTKVLRARAFLLFRFAIKAGDQFRISESASDGDVVSVHFAARIYYVELGIHTPSEVFVTGVNISWQRVGAYTKNTYTQQPKQTEIVLFRRACVYAECDGDIYTILGGLCCWDVGEQTHNTSRVCASLYGYAYAYRHYIKYMPN